MSREGTFDGAPKDAFSNLHKDAQEGVCEVALRVHLRLHLSCTCGCTFLCNGQCTNVYKMFHLMVDLPLH